MDSNVMTEPIDFTNRQIDDIIKIFDIQYLSTVDVNSNKQQFYCGITGDILQNLERHHVNGYTVCILCSSYEIASEVEQRLGTMGFDIGNPPRIGNGGNENSRIVYMIKKTEDFTR